MKIEKQPGVYNLIKIVKKLRSPQGCPWDKRQSHESLIPYFLEEVYEVIESIDERNWESLEEELGDVLLHILLQARIAEEASKFNFISLIEKLNEKIISRHPNVFNRSKNKNFNWEKEKHLNQNRESRLDGVPKKLSALSRSQRIQQKASSVGFDWNDIGPVMHKIHEEIKELELAIKLKNQNDIQEELGDVLFSIVNLSRHLGFSSENALRKSTNKFVSRFKKIEKELIEQGKDFENTSFEDLNNMWNKIKDQ